MAHDVFISHSVRDKAVADAVCHGLEAAGIRCWTAARDILPGKSWAGAITDAIGHSRIMVLVFSAESNRSGQVLREVERAVGKSIPIIPFRIDDVKPSDDMEYFLGAPHWLDAMSPPLDAHIKRLAASVTTLMQPTLDRPDAARAPSEGVDGASVKRPAVGGADSRRTWIRRVGISAGVLAIAGAVWAVTMSDSDSVQGEPPFLSVQPPELGQLATGNTNANLTVRVSYPASWRVTTGPGDSHIGIRDPASGTVFATGMERFSGPLGPPRDVATGLAATPGARYGQLAVTEALPASPGAAAFRLHLLRGAQPERGTVVIRQYSSGGTTFALWWMILGNDSASTRTASAMAQTIVTGPDPDSR